MNSALFGNFMQLYPQTLRGVDSHKTYYFMNADFVTIGSPKFKRTFNHFKDMALILLYLAVPSEVPDASGGGDVTGCHWTFCHWTARQSRCHRDPGIVRRCCYR